MGAVSTCVAEATDLTEDDTQLSLALQRVLDEAADPAWTEPMGRFRSAW